MSWKRLDHSHGGFSLVEVMIAILLLTVGLLAMAHLMTVATVMNAGSGKVSSSASIARATMERLKASPFYTDMPKDTEPTRGQATTPGGSLVTEEPGYVDYFDPEGKRLIDAEGKPDKKNALFVCRWLVETPNADGRLVLGMVRTTVTCRSLQEEGPVGELTKEIKTLGETRIVSYRTANVKPVLGN